MSRNRFPLIHRSLHFVDNNTISAEEMVDCVWKLRPCIEKPQANFYVSCDECQSVDEIMVPFKGRSILCMYLPKKPKKWGIKLWGRASPGGILHTFDVYQGKSTGLGGDETHGCGLGNNVVIQLTETLLKKPYKIFAKNFFTNFAMAAELKKVVSSLLASTQRIACMTHHQNLRRSCVRMEAEGHTAVCTRRRKICLVRWLDNKAEALLSTWQNPKKLLCCLSHNIDFEKIILNVTSCHSF